MALTTTVNKVIYSGNASSTVFSFTFPIPDATYLSVIYTDAAGVETTLSASLYSVTGIGTTTGGTVTYPLTGSPIAVSTKLTLVRTVPYTQPTVFSNQGGYFPEIVEGAFDRVAMEIQQLAEIVSRYTVSSISNPATEQTNYTLIQALQTFQTGIDKLTTAGDSLSFNGSSYVRLARGSSGQYLGVSGTALAWATPITYGFTGERQTVQHGPVTTAGLPSFLPATAASLNLTTQNISSSYPLVASSANGANTQGAVNAIGVSTANLTFSGLTLNRAAATPNYLYVTVVSGALTPAASLLAPIYQWGGTPSVTNDQFTYNIGEGRMYRGNGSTATQWSAVFVGEAATDATTVISTVAYAYNGQYESPFTATLPAIGTFTSVNHNIGVVPQFRKFAIRCNTIDRGYAVGDVLMNDDLGAYDGGNVIPLAVMTTSKLIGITAGSNQAFNAMTKTTGTVVGTLTLASWDYQFIASRQW